MSMTRKEATLILQNGSWWDCLPDDMSDADMNPLQDALDVALEALRPITREQAEKMRGEWIIEDVGDGDRRKKCSLCNQPISGWWGRDRFCANCGAPMTDEAVDMVLEKLEVLHGDL